MEVKSGEGTVVVADRNRYSDECCNNRGWGSGWGAVGGALVSNGSRVQSGYGPSLPDGTSTVNLLL